MTTGPCIPIHVIRNTYQTKWPIKILTAQYKLIHVYEPYTNWIIIIITTITDSSLINQYLITNL